MINGIDIYKRRRDKTDIIYEILCGINELRNRATSTRIMYFANLQWKSYKPILDTLYDEDYIDLKKRNKGHGKGTIVMLKPKGEKLIKIFQDAHKVKDVIERIIIIKEVRKE